MSSNVPTSSNVAALTFMLVATLWSVSATMPAGALAALTAVGVMTIWVVSVPARRPVPAPAEVQVRRSVDQGRA